MASNDRIPVQIAGTGSYLPDKILTNQDLERMVNTTDEWIITRTGSGIVSLAGLAGRRVGVGPAGGTAGSYPHAWLPRCGSPASRW